MEILLVTEIVNLLVSLTLSLSWWFKLITQNDTLVSPVIKGMNRVASKLGAL